VNWFREWDVRDLGFNATGKFLTEKYWKKDTHVFIADYRKMTVEKVESDGSLWCHFSWYTEGRKKVRQNVRLHVDTPVIELFKTAADSRFYVHRDNRDIGYLTAHSGKMGWVWDTWLTAEGDPDRLLEEGSDVSLSHGRELLLRSAGFD